MKTSKKIVNVRRLALGLAATLLAGGFGIVAHAQNSPVGDWDLVISGSQRGVAFLTFNKDSTIQGFEIITYRPSSSALRSSDPRNPTLGIDGRYIDVGATNSEFLIGLGEISGSWNFDSKGRTVGFFTPALDLTNNHFSQTFVAKVNPGKKLTLKTQSSPEPLASGNKIHRDVYTGVPFTPSLNVEGNWYGDGQLASTTNSASTKQKFAEFFLLTSAEEVPVFTNLVTSTFGPSIFFLSGTGPGYTNFGLAFVSNQKRMAIVSQQIAYYGTNEVIVLRALSGSHNTKKNTASLVGTDDRGSSISYKANALTQ